MYLVSSECVVLSLLAALLWDSAVDGWGDKPLSLPSPAPLLSACSALALGKDTLIGLLCSSMASAYGQVTTRSCKKG